MTILDDVNDVIIGDKVVCEARKVIGPEVINKSGRHKAKRITLKDNVRCTIIRKARFISRNP